MPVVTVAARSKLWVLDRSNADIVDSNFTRDMALVFLCCNALCRADSLSKQSCLMSTQVRNF